MTTPHSINPLIDETKPWGLIKFKHSDNKEHSFYFGSNSLSGCIMCGFDDDAPYVNGGYKWIKSILRDIKKKAKVLSYEGDKTFI